MDFENLFNLENTDDLDNQELIEKESNKLTTDQVKSYKIGRNDPCPCGSGKKYKKCCNLVTPRRSMDYYDQKLNEQIENINKHGKKKDIKNALKMALKADRDYPVEYAYSELAGIFSAELGNHKDAEQYLLKHYRIVKDDILDDAAIQLILSLIENNKYEKAEEISSNLIQNRNNSYLYILNGEINLNLDKKEKGYQTLIEAYKLTDKNLFYLDYIINTLLKNKFTYRSLRLLDDNYNRFKQTEESTKKNARELVELSLDNIYRLYYKNITTREYKKYLNKTLQVLEALDFDKKLTEEYIKKIEDIISKQYDVPLFLTRLFNNFWRYEYAIKNDKILYSYSSNKKEIAILLANFCYNNQNYKKAAHYYKIVLDKNYIKTKNLDNIRKYIKNYIFTLKNIDNTDEMKKLYKLLDDSLKEDPVKTIKSILLDLNSIQQAEIIEYMKNNLDLDLQEKIRFLDNQLANLVFNLKLTEEPIFDDESLDWIERLLTEYKEYDTGNFIYQYVKWLLAKRDNIEYDKNIEDIIRLNGNSFLSNQLKYFVTIKLVDPDIILNNKFDEDILKEENNKTAKDLAKIKKGDYSSIKEMLETDYDVFYALFGIISQLLDEDEILKLLKKEPELISRYFEEKNMLDMF